MRTVTRKYNIGGTTGVPPMTGNASFNINDYANLFQGGLWNSSGGGLFNSGNFASRIKGFNGTGTAQLTGMAADIFSGMLGDKREYGGKYGNMARLIDSTYDQLANAAGMIPVYGTAISAAMKVGALGNKISGKLGNSTDGMTKTDVILNNNFTNIGGLNPLANANGFFGRKTHSVEHNTWQEQAKIGTVTDAYNLTAADKQKALALAGKKYGLASRGARKRANSLIDDINRQLETLLQIADALELSMIRGLQQASINNQAYLNLINGDLNPIAWGKKGMKLLSFVSTVSVAKKGMKLLSWDKHLGSKEAA